MSMLITIITNDLRPPWATKAQFSTKLNWASNTMVFFSIYFSLTDATITWFSYTKVTPPGGLYCPRLCGQHKKNP